jgi:hypothetical protein
VNKKTVIGIAVVIALLCLIGIIIAGVGGYVYRDKLMAWLGLAQAQKVAGLLPAETQFYMAVTPNIQNMAGYENLKKVYLDNPDIQALFDDFVTEASGESGITFSEDIKPWLGTEVVLAAPNFVEAVKAQNDDPFGSAATPPIVMAADSINKAASDQFISKLLAEEAEKGKAFTDELYRDVALHVQKQDDATTIVTTFDNLVVISNQDSLVKGMIDQAKGNDAPSFAESERFKKITGVLPTNAILIFYMEFSGLFEAALAESAVQLPESQVKDLQAIEGLGMTGTLQPNGIQLDVVASYDIAKMSEAMKKSLQRPASPNAILNDIPAEALVAVNGFNLNQIWQTVKDSLESNPDFSQQINDLEQELGFSIEEDIFSWMTGEYAMVLTKAKPADEFTPPFGGYLLIGTDNVDQAQTHVDKVFGIIEEQSDMGPLENQTVQGIELKVAADFDGAFMGGYGFHKNYFLLAYQEDAVKALASAAQTPLANSPNFKAVQSRLPTSNYGYFYVDFDQLQPAIEAQLGEFGQEDYQKKVRPLIEPIHALGAAANTVGVDQGLSKGIFFIMISE